MLRITITKIKKAWSHSLALASRGRGVTKTFPGKFHKQLVVSIAQKSTDKGKDSGSRCEKCEKIIKYLFDPNSTTNDYQKLQEAIGCTKKIKGSTVVNDETKIQGTISDIQKVHDSTIVTVQNNQGAFDNDAQKIHGDQKTGKIVGKFSRSDDIVRLGKDVEPNTSTTSALTLQSTTAKQTDEQLAQKIEIIEETPLVEAERPKIEGFNSTPRVLGNSTDSTQKLPNTRIDREAIIKENLRHKIESLVRKIDNSLISENNSQGQNDLINFAANDSDQSDKSGRSNDKNNADEIFKRDLGSSTSQIDAHIVKGMKQLGVPGSSGNSTIVQTDAPKKFEKAIEKANTEVKAGNFKSEPPKAFSDKQNVESVEKVHLTFNIPGSTHVSHRDDTTLKGEVIHYSDHTPSIKQDKRATKTDKVISEQKGDVETNGEQLVDNKDLNNASDQSSVRNQTPDYPKMTPYGMWYPNFQPFYNHNANIYHSHGFSHQQNFWFNQNPYAYEYEYIQKNEPKDETTDQKKPLAIEPGPVLDNIQDPRFIVNKPADNTKLAEDITVKQSYQNLNESLSTSTKEISMDGLESRVTSQNPYYILESKTPLLATELRPILNNIQNSNNLIENKYDVTARTNNRKLTECIALKPCSNLNESFSKPSKELKQNYLENLPSSLNSNFRDRKKAEEPPFSLYGNFFDDQDSIATKQTAEIQSVDDKPTKQFYHMQKLQQSQYIEQNTNGKLRITGSQVSSLTYKTSCDLKTPILATEVKPIFGENENPQEKQIEAKPAEAKYSTPNELANTILPLETKTEQSIEPSNQTISHRILQSEALVNPSVKEHTPKSTKKGKDTSSTGPVPLSEITKKDEKISFSEMLRRVRMRSRMELVSQKNVIHRTEGKCGTPKPPCPVRAPTCPSPPPPPPCPCPPPDPPCPRPCKAEPCPPRCSPTPKKPCCKMISVSDSLKNIFVQLWDFGAIRFPQTPLCIENTCNCHIQLRDNSTKAILTQEVAIQLHDCVCRLLPTYRGLGESYWRLETYVLARSFEPWVPIPSWPLPKKEKKKNLVCPNEGCKQRPPPRYGAPCERPCYPGNPCLGFPNTFRKRFSTTDIFN